MVEEVEGLVLWRWALLCCLSLFEAEHPGCQFLRAYPHCYHCQRTKVFLCLEGTLGHGFKSCLYLILAV